MAALAVRDTRSQILDATEAVVMRDGARNLTLDAVAVRSDISKGGLPYHFRTKEDLAALGKFKPDAFRQRHESHRRRATPRMGGTWQERVN